jgi:flagellar basal-body rod modification protein FlgD
MVGRQVLVAGDKLNLADGSDPVFGVELQKAASQVNVAITDSAGQVVRNLSLGQTDAGIQDLAWDGLDVQGNRLPAGQYTLKVDATVDNKVEAGTSLVRVPVESVTLPRNGQAPMLNLAEYGSLSMDAVRRVF